MSPKKRYNFRRDLIRGKHGEDMLPVLWPDTFEPSPVKVRAYDLLHVDGRKVELKTDYYDHDSTPNCFMEYRSHEKPGGPWRALRDGVDIFAYLFVEPQPHLYVWEDVPALVAALDKHFVPDAPERRICNGKWAANGFLCCRERLGMYTNYTLLTASIDDNNSKDTK